jgi:hypothetical protein
MSDSKDYLEGMFDNATVIGIDGELVTSTMPPHKEGT